MALVPRGIERRSAWMVVALLCGLNLQCVAHAETPILILRQPDRIRKAWVEIDKIITENKKLARPLPDPYMARGDIWSRVGGHEDALSDYLKATELLFQGNPTPSEQARHLTQLRYALDALVQQPKPRYPNEAASEYSLGLLARRDGDYALAELHFAESCRLMPDFTLYRVHRALALHELGQNEEARRQVTVALSLVRATGRGASEEMRSLHRALEHVQGPSRAWLSRELELTAQVPAQKNRDAAR